MKFILNTALVTKLADVAEAHDIHMRQHGDLWGHSVHVEFDDEAKTELRVISTAGGTKPEPTHYIESIIRQHPDEGARAEFLSTGEL
jgi:hypothetical protein